jgi:DNA-binding response OmpR family regulator
MSEPLQVLVVDDDKSTCQLLNSVLTAEGYGCQVAHQVEEAEPLLRQGSYDLALVDIYLGTANGL